MLPRSPRSNLSAFLDRREIDELSIQAVRQWPICNHDVIRQRYDRIETSTGPSSPRSGLWDRQEFSLSPRGCRTRGPDLWCRSVLKNVAQGTQTVPSPAMD